MTTLTIPVHSHLWLSANDRIHWAPKAKRTRHLRIIGRLAAVDARIGRLGVSHVAAFIGYPRNGKADPANAAPTVKALIDGMVDAGVWADDDSTQILGPTYLRDPKTGEAGLYRVRFVITSQEIPWLTDDAPRDTPRIHEVGCHPLMVPGAGMCTCELGGEG